MRSERDLSMESGGLRRPFRIRVRAIVFFLALALCVAVLLFRCQFLVLIDNVFGTQLKPHIAVVDSESDLIAALENDSCILVVSHDWSIEDKFIGEQLTKEIACTQRLGKFPVFLLKPPHPDKDNGESDAMYVLLDRHCGTNGALPRFHRFVKSAGMTFIKSGERIEWIPRVWTFDNLKDIAISYSADGGKGNLSGEWRKLRLGDRIRFLRMPPALANPDYHVPLETRTLYELLIRTGISIEIADFTVDGMPVGRYLEDQSSQDQVFHSLVIDHTDDGCWVRVPKSE